MASQLQTQGVIDTRDRQAQSTSPNAGPLLEVAVKPELSAVSIKRSLSVAVSTPST